MKRFAKVFRVNAVVSHIDRIQYFFHHIGVCCVSLVLVCDVHIRLAVARSRVLQSVALFAAECTLIVLLITCVPCFGSLE